ncbi:hypothetical protein CLV62_101491 [Dysgonomonas alginatilytica]|uniref:Uncharacterized protein n=1 Tax=Dysgonomonas alginatilytica TaxID=1605892 RepID=A0A2V3PVR8_9BACT|nr:hypothetical protein [Dysgonomonas alginatilytica]PXV69222.1 hypothetical protein CLV62_101491 [Dysgonomonas alginatilytica]
MKTDLYTKTVLTVIAIFLGVLIFQNTSVISTVQAGTAATSPAPLPAAAQAAPVDVNIVQVAGVDLKLTTDYNFNSLSGIPVHIRYNSDK